MLWVVRCETRVRIGRVTTQSQLVYYPAAGVTITVHGTILPLVSIIMFYRGAAIHHMSVSDPTRI
jgi:hypothetical protein